jgi:hypothetical protein
VTYYESQYIESMANWFFKGINIIMRHAMDMFGDEIATNMLNKAAMTHFNNFYKPVPVEFLGRKGVFDFNWRMTKDVGMERNVFDFNFLGEFTGQKHHYSKLPKARPLKVEPRDGVLQIAVSDRTVNTFLRTA